MWLAWLVSCSTSVVPLGEPIEGWDRDVGSARPAPVGLSIKPVDELWVGELNEVGVEDAEGEAFVTLFVGYGEPGPGPCLHGDCFGIQQPIYRVATREAELDGDVDFFFDVPGHLPDGTVVSLQAWSSPSSGAVVSDPVETMLRVPVYGCLDEGAANYLPSANRDDGSCVYGCVDTETALDEAMLVARSCSVDADCSIEIEQLCCPEPGNPTAADLPLIASLVDYLAVECPVGCGGCSSATAMTCLAGQCEWSTSMGGSGFGMGPGGSAGGSGAEVISGADGLDGSCGFGSCGGSGGTGSGDW